MVARVRPSQALSDLLVESMKKGQGLGFVLGHLSPQDGVCGALMVEMLTSSEK